MKIAKLLLHGLRRRLLFLALLTAIFWVTRNDLAFTDCCLGQEIDSSDTAPTVGEWRSIDQLFLPGTELQPRPLVDDRQPIVVRIVQAFPHGTLGFRYDLLYSGYVPGEFDLREFLERIDHSSTDDLPPIPVRIRSVLPPGQIQPNPLSAQTAPPLGGYRWWLTAGVIVWASVFAALVFLGRRRSATKPSAQTPTSLAELLRPRIQAAIDNTIDPRQIAELERMLIAFWQRRLKLDQFPPNETVQQLRQHPESGPLLLQLERWIHDPSGERTVDLERLLQPLRDIPSDAAEWSDPTAASNSSSALSREVAAR